MDTILKELFTFLSYTDNGSTKTLGFVYDGNYYRQKYNYGNGWGFKFITSYPNKDVYLQSLSRTGEKVIYSSTMQADCTELGRLIEFSLSKLDMEQIEMSIK